MKRKTRKQQGMIQRVFDPGNVSRRGPTPPRLIRARNGNRDVSHFHHQADDAKFFGKADAIRTIRGGGEELECRVRAGVQEEDPSFVFWFV
mmetsp:Transcript_21131/g.44382  ORF Transcript_21131/g.44382 Transcript_21131/m.44382 type:complete len:91 (-) Transcript_21131:503-775(-)